MKPQLIEEITLSQEQLEVLNGALLGDGCLYKHKNGINAQLTYTSKSYQHINFIAEYFKSYISGEGIKNYSYLDPRTNKTYSSSNVKTYTNKTFTKIYNKWYIDGIKHIPEDLILTPLTCLVWYIGDGGICHSERSENIKLATQCFTKEEQEKILIPQLSQFEATLMKGDIGKDNIQQYFIYIPHRKEKDFLEYIGECPFSDYEYKWQIKEYINAIPKNHTSLEQEFCELYKQGETYYAIAKKYNIEPNAVKYYLIKNNLYISQNDSITKNAVIAYQENKPISIYKSGAEAAKQLKISSSGISQCCSGKKKTIKGYSWKKYNNLSEEEQQEIQSLFKSYFN